MYNLRLGFAGLDVSGAAITTLNGQPNTQSGSVGSPAPAVSLEAFTHLQFPGRQCPDTDHKLLQAEIQ